jgi:hypothetical protein
MDNVNPIRYNITVNTSWGDFTNNRIVNNDIMNNPKPKASTNKYSIDESVFFNYYYGLFICYNVLCKILEYSFANPQYRQISCFMYFLTNSLSQLLQIIGLTYYLCNCNVW